MMCFTGLKQLKNKIIKQKNLPNPSHSTKWDIKLLKLKLQTYVETWIDADVRKWYLRELMSPPDVDISSSNCKKCCFQSLAWTNSCIPCWLSNPRSLRFSEQKLPKPAIKPEETSPFKMSLLVSGFHPFVTTTDRLCWAFLRSCQDEKSFQLF